jgi:putative zinc finger/helix-turn-helix YgiT family protein
MKRECMNSRFSCPNCETIRDAEIVERQEQVTIKGREVTFKAQLTRCLTCGDEFDTPEQLDRNLEAAREAYARLYDAPTPEQLVTLRSRYGASQKAFGMILGFGELTMNCYEQGAAPSPPNRLLLKLAENPVYFRAMYDMNSGRIGAIQRQRVESSGEMQAAQSWKGLEALAGALTVVQREKIEACAVKTEKTVLELIKSYVSTASFKDYSNLMNDATWQEGVPLPVTSESQDLDFQVAL